MHEIAVQNEMVVVKLYEMVVVHQVEMVVHQVEMVILVDEDQKKSDVVRQQNQSIGRVIRRQGLEVAIEQQGATIEILL